MSLGWLEARRFRNLTSLSIEFDPGLNLLFGENGSGKTSLLEASYFLSSARSFRDLSIEPIIQRGEQDCLVRGKILLNDRQYQVGISRDRDGARDIHLNGESTRRASDLARLLPTLLLGPQSVDLLIGSPTLRRRFLNWGLFHVEPQFSETWEEANRCLRQRNLLLRQDRGTMAELDAWSNQLAAYAKRIDQMRVEYVQRYQPVFSATVQLLLGLADVRFDYFRGWGRDQELLETYLRDREIDQKRGFTQKGFQRADVRITVAGQPAVRVCSRGELKALVWAMILAQGTLVQDGLANRQILYLVDDLASEFDEEHRARVCSFLANTRQQVLLTGVERAALLKACADQYGRLFHVKHGEVEVQEY